MVELDFIRWLQEQTRASAHLPVGIGDDAAILKLPANRQLVATADTLTDRVHFDLQQHTLQRIGRKALAVNLSDLAAMAAAPIAALVSLNLPRSLMQGTGARELMEGLLYLAAEYDCPIAGGDTNVVNGPLSIAVTALGSVAPGKAWLRSGAKAGDRLLVTGQLGGSLLGNHLDFEPRINEALALDERFNIHAAIDISDGLGLDLARMCQASNVGANVDVDNLPLAAAAHERAQTSGRTAIEHALGDGEDFELLLAVAPGEARRMLSQQPLKCGLTDIGEFVAAEGLHQRDAQGNLTTLAPTGYEHQ